MYLIYHFVFFVLLCPYLSVLGVGPDPWDRNLGSKRTKAAEDEQRSSPHHIVSDDRVCHEDCDVGAWFYKMLLRFILNNGKFKDDESGCMEGILHFKIPVSNYKQIQNLLSSNTKITKDGYRIGNEFIMEALVTSKFDFLRDSVFSRVVMTVAEYYMYGVYCAAVAVGIYCLVRLHQRMTYDAKFFTISGIIILMLWEVVTLIKESEEANYLRLKAELASCSFLFWQSDCHVSLPSISDWWTKFNPGLLIMRIVTRFLYNPLHWFLQDVVKNLSDEFIWPINKFVYISLSMLTIFTVLFLGISFLANFVLGKPVKMGLLFNLMNVSLGHSTGHRQINDRRVTDSNFSNTDRISGDNLTNLLKLSNKLVDNLRDDSKSGIAFGTAPIRRKLRLKPEEKVMVRASSEGNLSELCLKEEENDVAHNTKLNVCGLERGDGDAKSAKGDCKNNVPSCSRRA